MNDSTVTLPPIDRDRALVSVVVPVFNEEQTIGAVLEKVSDLDLRKEIVVVDDGSTDGTPGVLESLKDLPGIRFFRLERNSGKGAALRRAFAEAEGDVVVVQDADLEYDPGDKLPVLEPILSGEELIVYGSRFLNPDGRSNSSRGHVLSNRLITLACNRVTGLKLTDVETGHKAFRIEVLRQLELHENRFGIELEISAKVARLGFRIREVGVSYRPRSRSEGKKLGWRDGVSALRCVLKYGLLGR